MSLLLSSSADASHRADEAAAATLETGQPAAFGFQLGEERRYAMEPDALGPGEFEHWTLRLEEVVDDAGTLRATFFYSYEYARVGGGLEGGRSERYLGRARATVNQRGFPLFVEYLPTELNGVTSGNEHNGRVSWTGRGFHVQPGPRSPFAPFDAVVPDAESFSAAVPEGVFLSERENPALVTLPASILLSDGGHELPYVALWPTELRPGGDRRPTPRRPTRPRRGRISLDFEPERRGFAPTSLRFLAIETIEVGPRSYEARGLESKQTGANVWVGVDGRLLRFETRHRNRRVFIRLLHPSEY